MIIAHANVFFDLVILLGRDMNCVVVSVGSKRNNGRTMTRINLFCRMRLGNY